MDFGKNSRTKGECDKGHVRRSKKKKKNRIKIGGDRWDGKCNWKKGERGGKIKLEMSRVNMTQM